MRVATVAVTLTKSRQTKLEEDASAFDGGCAQDRRSTSHCDEFTGDNLRPWDIRAAGVTLRLLL